MSFERAIKTESRLPKGDISEAMEGEVGSKAAGRIFELLKNSMDLK